MNRIVLALVAGCFSISAFAQDYKEGKIEQVYVTAGADGPSPGVTCFKLRIPVAAQCPYGFIAVPNNNSKLINTLLIAKTTDVPVWINYSYTQPVLMCPALAQTPCVVVTVALRDPQ
jgi:hypothetical protein